MYARESHITLLILSGLRFELLQTGVAVDEDVGTVKLCVSYMGDNVPPTIDANIHYSNYENCKSVYIFMLF